MTLTAQEIAAYSCPVWCGCLWRDNGDGTMSLFNGQHSSCALCERLPLDQLLPLYTTPQPSNEQALQDMLDDARLHLAMLQEALGVPTEPHQVLFERMLERARSHSGQKTGEEVEALRAGMRACCNLIASGQLESDHENKYRKAAEVLTRMASNERPDCSASATQAAQGERPPHKTISEAEWDEFDN